MSVSDCTELLVFSRSRFAKDLVMCLRRMPDNSPCASLRRDMVKETLLVALSPRAKGTPKVS